MRKALRFVLAVALAAGMAGVHGVAGADEEKPCNDNLYVFSSYGQQVDDPTQPSGKRDVRSPSYAIEAAGCDFLTESDPTGNDTRYIYPGANQVSVRFLGGDFGPDVPTLTGHITGLGLDQAITLHRGRSTLSEIVGGSYYYDSPVVYIDPTLSGTLTVTVTVPAGVDEQGNPVTIVETDQYRTLI